MDDWIHRLMESHKSIHSRRLPKERWRLARTMQVPNLASEPPALLPVAGFCTGFNPFSLASNLRLSAFAPLR